jgi:hypothetical protein
MEPHWSGYIARDGHYPDPSTKQCFADEEDVLKYLAAKLAEREDEENAQFPVSANADRYWERAEEYHDGFADLEDRLCDMTRGDKDPGEWIGMGPAVLVRGIDYVMEGCNGTDCTVQEASVDA